jgi:hypothetical protein
LDPFPLPRRARRSIWLVEVAVEREEMGDVPFVVELIA